MFDIKQKTSDYMNLIVTHSCNKRCLFCVDGYVGEESFIKMKDVKKALFFAKRKGVKDILIVGGEPTLHPDIINICKMVSLLGFRSIMTTNYTRPDIIRSLDALVDCFNISFYFQKELPKQKDFVSDITIHALIHKKQLNTKEKLDSFIERYKGHGHLKFSTLTPCNEFSKNNQKVDYLDELPAEKVVLFDEICGQIYNGHVIKRHDIVYNNRYENQSLKAHVNGVINRSWSRDEIMIDPETIIFLEKTC